MDSCALAGHGWLYPHRPPSALNLPCLFSQTYLWTSRHLHYPGPSSLLLRSCGASQFGKLSLPLSFPPNIFFYITQTLHYPLDLILNSFSDFYSLCFSHFLVLGLKGRYFTGTFMTCQFSPAVRTGTNIKTGFITPRAWHQDAVKWGQGSLPWGPF